MCISPRRRSWSVSVLRSSSRPPPATIKLLLVVVVGGGWWTQLNTVLVGYKQRPTPQQLAQEFNTEGAIVVKAKKVEPTFDCVSFMFKNAELEFHTCMHSKQKTRLKAKLIIFPTCCEDQPIHNKTPIQEKYSYIDAQSTNPNQVVWKLSKVDTVFHLALSLLRCL